MGCPTKFTFEPEHLSLRNVARELGGGNHIVPRWFCPVHKQGGCVLIEDKPSFCLRECKVWMLKKVDLLNNQGMILASL